MPLQAGLTASADYVVTNQDTAVALGSGDVEVLATPRVLAWCEALTVEIATPTLDPHETTVGMRVRLDHVRATPVGATVTIAAQLTKVEGRRLTFDVSATDEHGEVADGQVVRVIVIRKRFMERAAEGPPPQ